MEGDNLQDTIRLVVIFYFQSASAPTTVQRACEYSPRILVFF